MENNYDLSRLPEEVEFFGIDKITFPVSEETVTCLEKIVTKSELRDSKVIENILNLPQERMERLTKLVIQNKGIDVELASNLNLTNEQYGAHRDIAQYNYNVEYGHLKDSGYDSVDKSLISNPDLSLDQLSLIHVATTNNHTYNPQQFLDENNQILPKNQILDVMSEQRINANEVKQALKEIDRDIETLSRGELKTLNELHMNGKTDPEQSKLFYSTLNPINQVSEAELEEHAEHFQQPNQLIIPAEQGISKSLGQVATKLENLTGTKFNISKPENSVSSILETEDKGVVMQGYSIDVLNDTPENRSIALLMADNRFGEAGIAVPIKVNGSNDFIKNITTEVFQFQSLLNIEIHGNEKFLENNPINLVTEAEMKESAEQLARDLGFTPEELEGIAKHNEEQLQNSNDSRLENSEHKEGQFTSNENINNLNAQQLASKLEDDFGVRFVETHNEELGYTYYQSVDGGVDITEDSVDINNLTPEAVELAIAATAAKFGNNIIIDGSDEFKAQVIDAIANNPKFADLNILNPELQEDLAMARLQNYYNDLDLTIPKETLEKNSQVERYTTQEEAIESDKSYVAKVNGEYLAFNSRDELVSAVVEDHNQDYKMDKDLSDAYYDAGIEEFGAKLVTDQVKANPRDAVLEKLVAALEKNDGTWQKTWSVIADNRPHNPISGTNYRGVNLLSLAVNATENNYNDPRWCTYNQAKEAGHPVAAGQKCTAQVLFYKVDTILKNGDKEYTLRGKDLHESAEKLINQMYPNKPCKLNRDYSVDKAIGFVENQYPNLSHRTSAVAKLTPVFNFSQMENAPELEVKSTVRTWDNNQDIEQLVQNSGVKVVHDQIDSNFYLPGKNEIHLTPKASFDTPEKYYSTLLHEVSHAKIADGTLEFSTDFSKYHEDKTVRAKEELRAEISSVFLCSELGLNYDVQNHANYLNSWLKNIKEDKQEFWSAVSDSNRIANGVLAYENQIEKDKSLTSQKEVVIEMNANSLNKNDQSKLEDVINNYNSILQSVDKKDLLSHQRPNCVYTASGKEIHYSESSIDLHGSLTNDSKKLTIDGKVAYEYKKYGLSPSQTTFNRELLNEVHTELHGIKNQSLDKDLDLTISKEILAKNTPEIYDSKSSSLDSDKYYLTNINGEYVAFNIREELLSAVVEDHNQDYKMDKELSDAYYDGSLDDFAKKLAEHEQLEPIEIEEMDQVREQEQEYERD